MYEGTPDFPDKDRLWSIVEKYGVTILYTAPTAIRTFMKWGTEFPERARPLVAAAARQRRRADQPRGLGLVLAAHRRRALPGRRHVVADRDRRHHDQPAAGRHHAQARAARPFPLPGIGADIVDDAGERSAIPGGGYLVLTRPWPSMLRGIWGDPERYRETYWSRFDGRYFAGDGAKRDDDGYFWLLGRVDDVMLVVGPQHLDRRGRARARRPPAVAEAAVVGRTDATTGQAIAAFVILRAGNEPSDDARRRAARPRRRTHRPDRASRSRSSSPRTCRRRARARSCAGCCATSPRTRRSATRRRSPTRRRRGHQGALPRGASGADEE